MYKSLTDYNSPSFEVIQGDHWRFHRETRDQSTQRTAKDIVCFSHIRWSDAWRRPQHLLSRFARNRRVYFIEEPIAGEGPVRLEVQNKSDHLTIVIPHVSKLEDAHDREVTVRRLIDELLQEHYFEDYLCWYFTPNAIGYSRHLSPSGVVYDCIDGLTENADVDPQLKQREEELLTKCNLVITSGPGLYDAKRKKHSRVHCFASGVDSDHFRKARIHHPEPFDQKIIPSPRIGFMGTLDNRVNFDLIRSVAKLRPQWHFVLVGKLRGIKESAIPAAPNIHYLGAKTYAELPHYLSGWDATILPYKHSEETRFLNPTKTLEYLSAGKPVVATSLRDVVRPFGKRGLVYIADTPFDFVRAVEKALMLSVNGKEWRSQVDSYLAQTSWEKTFNRIEELVKQVGHETHRRIVG